MKKQTKIIIALITFIVLLIAGFFIYKQLQTKNATDAEKFSTEYTKVGKNNVFVYRELNDIIDILKHGTGIVYLGFPECPWCQEYVVYLNEVARDNGIDRIFYYNIKEDREKNSKEYQEVVTLLKDHLAYDNEGKQRIFVPDITFVQEGEIVGHDNETSMISEEGLTPEKYWTKENVAKLKAKLQGFAENINSDMCTKCNQ